MLARDIYYEVKPFLPRRIRFALRRIWARRIREASKDIWPIDPATAQPSAGWPGWPDGKKFSFILTHDIEGPEGLAKCRQLAELEIELGFRSSFNFIPEGTYKVPAELRNWLTEHGFEVGVHDLHHDGKLFRNRKTFSAQAVKINHYIRDWRASGFRAGFMHNHLEWQHDIKATYDASTFDTDPFEPQPTGAGTIFPFMVQRNEHEGYLELPYTMAQDSTLFLLFREPTPDLWVTKLDWLAEHGGMVLMNTHPDYISLDGVYTNAEYPLSFYRDLLLRVKSKFHGKYWHALPREVAKFALQHRNSLMHRQTSLTRPAPSVKGVKIWIDLENTPHIPFFNPIIKELKKRGHSVVLTARDAYQTCEMADLYGLKYTRIGHHYGKRIILKALGLGVRVVQLVPFIFREKPSLALNHGARAQTTLCNVCGIPNVTIMDYEHSSKSGIADSKWQIIPEVVANERADKVKNDKLLTYAGIKEDVYVTELKPDPAILKQLCLTEAKVIITVRPPASEAHYHNKEADVLFKHFMNRAVGVDGAKVVLLPRNKRQEEQIRSESPHWFKDSKVIIPDTVVEGMNLLWFSDLVVSGGGTMNREAAALGVPVYSIFRGTIGAVDHYLQAAGRLTLIENIEEVDNKIIISPRPKSTTLDTTPRKALSDIVDHIEDIINSECAK